MDNSESRLNDVFFYGLYMDPEILRSRGVEPRNPRKGVVQDFRLRIGNLATLLREKGAHAHGIIYALTHEELNRLYWGAGLTAYVAEALAVKTEDGRELAVLCCNLLIPPHESEANAEYKDKLLQCMKGLGLPQPVDYA